MDQYFLAAPRAKGAPLESLSAEIATSMCLFPGTPRPGPSISGMNDSRGGHARPRRTRHGATRGGCSRGAVRRYPPVTVFNLPLFLRRKLPVAKGAHGIPRPCFTASADRTPRTSLSGEEEKMPDRARWLRQTMGRRRRQLASRSCVTGRNGREIGPRITGVLLRFHVALPPDTRHARLTRTGGVAQQ